MSPNTRMDMHCLFNSIERQFSLTGKIKNLNYHGYEYYEFKTGVPLIVCISQRGPFRGDTAISFFVADADWWLVGSDTEEFETYFSMEELRKLVLQYDADGNETLDIDEFVNLFHDNFYDDGAVNDSRGHSSVVDSNIRYWNKTFY